MQGAEQLLIGSLELLRVGFLLLLDFQFQLRRVVIHVTVLEIPLLF